MVNWVFKGKSSPNIIYIYIKKTICINIYIYIFIGEFPKNRRTLGEKGVSCPMPSPRPPKMRRLLSICRLKPWSQQVKGRVIHISHNIYIFIYIYIFLYIYIYFLIHIYIYIYIHSYTYILKYNYIYIYIVIHIWLILISIQLSFRHHSHSMIVYLIIQIYASG